MNEIATVFGGTGFLGQRVVRALVKAGYVVRVAARNPDAVDFSGAGNKIQRVAVDIRNDAEVRESVLGSTAVVNAVSLYVEKEALTFDAIHVEGADRVARYAKQSHVEHLVHISGIGVSTDSPSAFVRARAEGEQAVIKQFPGPIIVRPSVMCGRGDAFLAALQQVARLPVAPLFGRGNNKLQPVPVGNVAAAVARLAALDTKGRPDVYELGGSEVHSYRQLLELVMRHRGKQHPLVPVPFLLWQAVVKILSVLPNPPLTRDQLILMQTDNVVGTGVKTFADLSMAPRGFTDALRQTVPAKDAPHPASP